MISRQQDSGQLYGRTGGIVASGAARPVSKPGGHGLRIYRPNSKPKVIGKKLSEFPLVCTLM
jgi:hypothetical protein